MNSKTPKIIYFLLSGILLLTPACGKKKTTSNLQKAPEVLATSVDLFGDIKKEKLIEQGLDGVSTGKKKMPPVHEKSALLEGKEEAARAQGEQITEKKEVETALAKEKKFILPEYLFLEGDDTIEFNFENADLEQLTKQIESVFNITFISDDALVPTPQGGKVIKGNKISFKTQQPLTRKDAWDLYITFLDMAGLTIIPESNPRFFRITTIDTAKKSALPVYIGVPHETLPDNDQLIRYVYFVENTTVDTLKSIVDSLRSSNSTFTVLQDMKAFILTDKAYNVRSLLHIVKELDKVVMPQSMSVLKLRRVDAEDVKKLYDTLIGVDEKSATASRLFPQLRKQPSSLYFPENTRIIPEPRSNSLILLGPIDAIRRIEAFIREYIDTPLDQPYSPLFVLPLRYADANTIANVMNEVTQFGKNTAAGKTGGVRGGDKYFRPIYFTPEPETNRLVIKGDYEDFLRAKEIITQLDSPQPQVAIEVLLLNLTASNIEQLGAVLRSRQPGTGTQFLGSQATFQTTGLFKGNTQQGVQLNSNPASPGVLQLLGNLLNLVNFSPAGSTIISLGDTLSVWAILQVLQTITATEVLANPFIVATNKTKAQVALGQINRVVTGTVMGTAPTQAVGDAPARLEINVTPQINADGMVILDLTVMLQQFVGAANPLNTVRTERTIKTKTILADKEVLALGGLVQNQVDNTVSKVPILGDIPILGWLFKNRSQSEAKNNLLVLISARIMRAEVTQQVHDFTQDRVHEYRNTLDLMRITENMPRDPIDRWFFSSASRKEETDDIEKFIFRHDPMQQNEQPVPKSLAGQEAITQPNIEPPASITASVAKEQLPKPAIQVAENKNRKSLIDLLENAPAAGARS